MIRSHALTLLVFVGLLPLSALAQYVTVGGSKNGTFTISGEVYIFIQNSCYAYGWPYMYDGTPESPPLPLVVETCDYSGAYGQTCQAVMNGDVKNGQAEIDNVSLKGDVGCFRTVVENLPWPIEVSPGYGSFNAKITSGGFYAPASMNCHSVTITINLGGNYVGFGSVTRQGCNLITYGNASTVTPALNVVP